MWCCALCALHILCVCVGVCVCLCDLDCRWVNTQVCPSFWGRTMGRWGRDWPTAGSRLMRFTSVTSAAGAAFSKGERCAGLHYLVSCQGSKQNTLQNLLEEKYIKFPPFNIFCVCMFTLFRSNMIVTSIRHMFCSPLQSFSSLTWLHRGFGTQRQRLCIQRNTTSQLD